MYIFIDIQKWYLICEKKNSKSNKENFFLLFLTFVNNVNCFEGKPLLFTENISNLYMC